MRFVKRRAGGRGKENLRAIAHDRNKRKSRKSQHASVSTRDKCVRRCCTLTIFGKASAAAAAAAAVATVTPLPSRGVVSERHLDTPLLANDTSTRLSPLLPFLLASLLPPPSLPRSYPISLPPSIPSVTCTARTIEYHANSNNALE